MEEVAGRLQNELSELLGVIPYVDLYIRAEGLKVRLCYHKSQQSRVCFCPNA